MRESVARKGGENSLYPDAAPSVLCCLALLLVAFCGCCFFTRLVNERGGDEPLNIISLSLPQISLLISRPACH